MNAGHVIASSAVTGALAQVLIYVSQWFAFPMDEKTAIAFATLAVIGFGGGSILANRKSDSPPSS